MKTKKIILVLIIGSIYILNLKAQERAGLIGGTSVSSYTGKDFPNTYIPNIGVAAGVFIEGILTYPVSIVFEVNVEQKGVKYWYYPLPTTEIKVNSKLDYFSLPILIKTEFGYNRYRKLGYFVYAGPVVSYLLSHSFEASATETGHVILWQPFFDYSFAKFDAGLAIGMGLIYREIIFDVRYIHGANNLYKGDDIPDIRNHSLTVKVGFSLYKRKKSKCYRGRL